MASWRDNVSKTAQADLGRLVEAVVPLAKQLLTDSGQFVPFGAALNMAGDLRMLTGHPGGRQPVDMDVLEGLLAVVLGDRDNLRAVAFVADVRFGQPPEPAVLVELEHREGATQAFVLRHSTKRLGRGVEYGGLAGIASARRVWTS
jgi:hypothetical protein